MSEAQPSDAKARCEAQPSDAKAGPEAPVGPYTPVVEAGEWLIVSGQVGLAGGKLVSGGLEAELRQALTNVAAQLESKGSRLAEVVKTTVFLRHLRDYDSMNRVYVEVFGETRPARSALGVVELPMGALVEVEAWAHRQQ